MTALLGDNGEREVANRRKEGAMTRVEKEKGGSSRRLRYPECLVGKLQRPPVEPQLTTV